MTGWQWLGVAMCVPVAAGLVAGLVAMWEDVWPMFVIILGCAAFAGFLSVAVALIVGDLP